MGRSTKRFVFLNLFILFLHTCYICVCFQLVAFVRVHMWHKALLIGYSMRLELTLVSSLNLVQYCSQHSCVIAVKLFLYTYS